MNLEPKRTLPWDWYPGTLPGNAIVDETAYIETTFSFHLYRSVAPKGLEVGRGASTYLGTMFDVGPRGHVRLGQFSLVHGARIICDDEIIIGDHCLISWNVVLMDTYRVPLDPADRRQELRRTPWRTPRYLEGTTEARAVYIGNNVWIGFDACVLPGVTIGEGAIVGARSVVFTNVEPYTIVAGNPARLIRQISEEEINHEE